MLSKRFHLKKKITLPANTIFEGKTFRAKLLPHLEARNKMRPDSNFHVPSRIPQLPLEEQCLREW